MDFDGAGFIINISLYIQLHAGDICVYIIYNFLDILIFP
jgi:hypothetical protein